MLPYVNNEHISNVYKIYAPYLKNGNVNKNKDKNNLKSIEKLYDYHNMYKPKKGSLDSSMNSGSPHGGKLVVNRKLSPLHKKQQLIKI